MTKETEVKEVVKETEKKEEIQKNSPKETERKLSINDLLENGVHFGHKKSTRNPKMNPYIFGIRRGVNIIDLEKTFEKLEEALNFIEKLIEKNGKIIIVGTKKQAKTVVKEVADEIEMPYVNERWIGGTFTNFKVILNRLRYFKEQRKALEEDRLKHLTKLEKSKLNKELKGMESRMGGLINMTRLPEAVFVLDVDKDQTAVREARKQGIKVIALVDTNNNPEGLDYFIPANNDALSSLRYILEVLAQRVKKAQNKKF